MFKIEMIRDIYTEVLKLNHSIDHLVEELAYEINGPAGEDPNDEEWYDSYMCNLELYEIK